MSIATQHPQYDNYAPRWTRMGHALMDEDAVKAQRVAYLPKTAGMIKNDTMERDYNAYLMRARFPEITSSALSGVVGLVFEKSPEGAADEPITQAGQTNVELARETLRGVAGRGRDILVVDAPRAPAGGTPFITRYAAESLINWKLDPANPGTLSLAVFAEEDAFEETEYGHERRTTYRKYQQVDGRYWVSRWIREDERDILIEEPILLPVPFMPIVIPGSIDLKPDCDPIPLLPVARCAFSYFLKSATYEHGLYLTQQPTPWIMGVDEEQYEKIRQQGFGSSSFWHLGENGAAGFLQSANDPGALERAMERELEQAETHAIKLTQATGSPESGKAMAMRAAAQHASIYSMADSVSQGITQAMRMRAVWAGQAEPEPFRLRAEFSDSHGAEQMINALNAAINAGNAPREAMFETLRRTGTLDMSNEDMLAAIQEQIAAGGLSINLGDPERRAA